MEAARVAVDPRRSDVTLRALAALGSAAFALFFLIALVAPGSMETRARNFVVQRVTAEIGEGLSASDIPAELSALSERLAARADSMHNLLRTGFSQRLAGALSSICVYDCNSTDDLDSMITTAFDEEAGSLGRAAITAASFARNRYAETVRALVRDIRIFSGVNTVLFALVFVASIRATATPRQVRWVLWLLLAATLVTAICYVFVQDWFHTLLFARFIGFGYLAWVILVFAVLLDWTLNKGRVTAAIVHAAGAALSPVS
jgi:hypothetical protein